MLAYKLKKKRDIQTISHVESQWKRILDHLEESENLRPMATQSDTIEKPFDNQAIVAKPINVTQNDLDSSLRILTTHCFTAMVLGLASVMTGIVSSVIASAYLTGVFATCGFVGLELFRIRVSS